VKVANVITNTNILAFQCATILNSQVAINTVHALVTGIVAGVPTDLDAATAMDAYAVGAFKAVMTSAATYRGWSCRIMDQSPPFPAASYTGSTGVGTSGATPLPGQDRPLVSFTTSFSGRAFRGRLYLPFPSTADTTAGGQPNAGMLTRMQTVAALFGTGPITFVNSGRSFTAVPVVYHAKAGKTGIPAAKTATTIIAYIVRTAFATQRKSGFLGRTNLLPF